MQATVENKEGLARELRSLGIDAHEVLVCVPNQILVLDRRQHVVAVFTETYRRRDGEEAGDERGGLQLSAREHDVVRLLRDGYRPRSIAQFLHVSPQTVRNHLKAIFKKTGTHSQEQLIALSRRPAGR